MFRRLLTVTSAALCEMQTEATLHTVMPSVPISLTSVARGVVCTNSTNHNAQLQKPED